MTPKHRTVVDQIDHYIRQQFNVLPDDERFASDTHLWDQGYVDSTGLVELLVFLETNFGVSIPDEALFSPDFTCVAGIARIVLTQLEAGEEPSREMARAKSTDGEVRRSATVQPLPAS